MLFKNVNIEPGVIIDTNDPEHLQRVKCTIAGIYDPSTMDKEVIPWIRPWMMNKHQNFTMPMVGNKVWVVINNDNYNECYYLFMHEYDQQTKAWVDAKYGKDAELILSRINGDSTSQISYDTDDGIVSHIGEFKSQITPTGNIINHGNGGDVDIRDGNVYCGSNDSEYEYAVLGETLVQLFQDLGSALSEASNCVAGAYMASSMKPILAKAAKICSEADKIKTKKLKVN